jgi:hypothetical protein
MLIRTRRVFILIVICLTSVVLAQEKFSGEKSFSYIEKLCRHEFRGRKTGLKGAREAAIWIAGQFESWGMKPGGDNNSFLQDFQFIVTRQNKVAKMKLKNGLFGSVTYQEGNDFIVYFNSGSGRVTSEVVFAGFGISEPEKDWDDYAGIDVRGKIVMIYRGQPANKIEWSTENGRDYKMQMAAKHGVAALLILESRDWPVRGGTIHEEGYFQNIPAVNISKKAARDIFQGTFKNMDYVLRDLKKSPQSFATGKIVSIETEFERIEPGIGENVIGILPGSDPVLKNEYIVVGGHMDHNGMTPDGHLYAGADDNASGTAVVMELARTIAARGSLKRSIVFVGFGGEEQGLRGSKYFAENPTVPENQICLMFNFDMEGCGTGGGGFGGRNYFPKIIDEVLSVMDESVRKRLSVSRGWGMGGSDHAHFIEQGIPAFGFFSTGGHPFYHRVEDTPRTINKESLQFVGDRACELLVQFGNWPQSLLFKGNRQGRCFIHYGDQMNFQLKRIPEDKTGKELAEILAERTKNGVRAVVVTLNDPDPENLDLLDLYMSIDSLDAWIKEHNECLIRYQSGSSLNASAGSGKMAVAIGLEGTFQLNEKIGLFRNIVRLGLDVIHISDSEDPVFKGKELSVFGKEVFKVCQNEKVLIDWTINDEELISAVMLHYQGPALIRMDMHSILGMYDKLCMAKKGESLLIVAGCCMESKAVDLSGMIDLSGSNSIHFSMIQDSCAPCNKGQARANRTKWKHQLIQDLYDLRIKDRSKEDVYRDMVRVLGGNLKANLK